MITITRFKPKYFVPETSTEREAYLLIVRCVGVVALTALFFHALITIDVYKFFAAYTQWGMLFTLSLFLLLALMSLFGAVFPELVAFSYAYYEIVWSSEFVITVIFWTVLVPYSVFIAHREVSWNIMIFNFEAHSLPMLFLYLDRIHNGIVFSYWHLPLVILPSIPYSISSFLCAYLGHIVVYPFLDWKDWKSIAAVMGMWVLAAIGFYVGKILGSPFSKKYQYVELNNKSIDSIIIY